MCDKIINLTLTLSKAAEHAMKIVERMLENRIRGLVTINHMQFDLMPGKGTTHALVIQGIVYSG